MIKNTETSYGSITKFLHWGIFILFVGMFILAEVMMDMEKGPDRWQLYGLHKATGIVLLFIIGFRILWRLSNITPLLPNNMKPFEQKMAHLGHFALYVCMIALPISGYVMSMAGGHGISFYGFFDVINLLPENKGMAEIAHEIHEMAAEALYFLVPLHIVAAVFHHHVRKDDVLTKMLPTCPKKGN